MLYSFDSLVVRPSGRGHDQDLVGYFGAIDPCVLMKAIADAFRPTEVRLAAVRLTGWPFSLQAAAERAGAADEVLHHPMNQVRIGLLDLAMQRVVPCPGHSADILPSDVVFRSLYDAGRYADAGFVRFEGFETSQSRIAWIVELLSICSAMMPECAEIRNLVDIGRVERRWDEAHTGFSRVRDLVLEEDRRRRASDPYDYTIADAVLGISEQCAKVIYNESMAPMPFDRDSGWALVPAVVRLSQRCSPAIAERWQSALLGSPDAASKAV